MKVYKDFMTGEEFFSDAKDIEEVKDEAGNYTGLVRVKAIKQTAGGDKIDVGATGEFTAAGAEDVDDKEETKWDQFWNFPSIENQHAFATFKECKDALLMPLLLAFKKLGVEKGVAKDKDDLKEKGTRIANFALKWIQTNFKDLEFYSLESTVLDGSDYGEAFKDDTFGANFAILYYEGGTTPYFYFIRDLFTEAKF